VGKGSIFEKSGNRKRGRASKSKLKTAPSDYNIRGNEKVKKNQEGHHQLSTGMQEKGKREENVEKKWSTRAEAIDFGPETCWGLAENA